MGKKATLVFLDIFLILSSVLLSLSFNPLISAASFDFFATLGGLESLLLMALAVAVWTAAASLISYFSPSFNRLSLGFILSSLAFGFFLNSIGNILVRLGLSTFLLFSLFLFAAKVRRESTERIGFSAPKIFGGPLKILTTLVAALLCLSFFFPYRVRIETEGFRAPEVLIDRVVGIVGQKAIDTVVGQFAQSSKLKNPEAVFTEIPEELGEAGLVKTLEQEFGIKIDSVPKNSADLLEMVKPSLEGKIRSEIESTLGPLTPLLPALISLLLFLTLLPLSTVVAIFTVPLVSLAFFLLEALELTTTKTTTVESIRPILQD